MASSGPLPDPLKVSFFIFKVLTDGFVQTFFLESNFFISVYSNAK